MQLRMAKIIQISHTHIVVNVNFLNVKNVAALSEKSGKLYKGVSIYNYT